MHCTHVHIPGLGEAIVCTSGRRRPKHCIECDRVARFACDWKTGGGETCDRQLCPVHAEEVAENKHLCPAHSKAWAQWRAQRTPGGALPQTEPQHPQAKLFA